MAILKRHGTRFFRLILGAALLAAPGEAQQPLEYQVKAAFLLNFTKFVQWPSSAFAGGNAPLTICVLGENPFEDVLDRLVEGESVNGRRLAVQKIRRPAAARTCQVLYVRNSEADVRKTLAEAGPGVLTVGEGDGFLREGGMISFVVEDRKVRFDINQKAATNAMLEISARLLGVARSVQK